MQFDELLVCAGRLPNVESLGLPAAGVGLTKEGRVSINDHLQTENPNVYAVGDCCMSTQFTHVAVSPAPVATLDFRLPRSPSPGSHACLLVGPDSP